MSTQIYTPEGQEHSRSRNLRGLLDNARRRGVKWVRIYREIGGSANIIMEYEDQFYAKTYFASASIAEIFCRKRWPDKTL